jgi:hypothetical protein
VLHRLFGDTHSSLPELRGCPADEVMDQGRDLVAPLAQRRDR